MVDLIRAVGSAGTWYPYTLITTDMSYTRIVPGPMLLRLIGLELHTFFEQLLLIVTDFL